MTQHPDYAARWAAANAPWTAEQDAALHRYAQARGGGGHGALPAAWASIAPRAGAPAAAAAGGAAATGQDPAAAAAAARAGAPCRYALLRRFNELLVNARFFYCVRLVSLMWG